MERHVAEHLLLHGLTGACLDVLRDPDRRCHQDSDQVAGGRIALR